jgi:hypothetical protein
MILYVGDWGELIDSYQSLDDAKKNRFPDDTIIAQTESCWIIDIPDPDSTGGFRTWELPKPRYDICRLI